MSMLKDAPFEAKIRRSYVDTLDGQIHVTEAGSGRPLVMLPWFPRSATMYLDELEPLASAGVRAVAFDLMGYGNSATQNTAITVSRQADNLERALDVMGLENPVILGGHYNSQVAVELASRPTVQASLVVIDGGVLIGEAKASELMAKTARVKPALFPQPDGAHREFLWANAENIFDIYAPGFVITPETTLPVYRQIHDYLSRYLQDPGPSFPLPQPENYPFAEMLSKLTIPAVFITAETETLASSVGLMSEIYGGPFEVHEFEGDHPLHYPARKGEYAQAIINVLSKTMPDWTQLDWPHSL